MKTRRKIIEIDEERCSGCARCVTACAEGAIEIVNGKARVIKDTFCDGLGACIGECPEGALAIAEREADPFDEQAVERHLKERHGEPQAPAQDAPLPCGCPSTHVQILATGAVVAAPATVSKREAPPSALAHWPVQIRLVPPSAPFLKGASLLVAADCTPVACPNFHEDYLGGRSVLIGCPKFDDTDEYINKFKDIFVAAPLKDVTVLIMEVPCCSGLPMIVRKGLALSGRKVPIEVITISARGQIVRQEAFAA